MVAPINTTTMETTQLMQKITDAVKAATENIKTERIDFGMFTNPFRYGAWCEKNLEANLREDYKRKTTFACDFGIAEWCGGKKAVIDTFQRAIKEWKNNIEYFAELIISVQNKAWEMNARDYIGWSMLYSELYYIAKEAYFDWFEGNEIAEQYYFSYVD